MTSPYTLSAAETALIATATELAVGFAERAARHDDEASLLVENLRAIHEAGLNRAVLPAALGGTGLSYQAFGEITRIFAEADPSTATVWLMHLGAGVGLAAITAETRGGFFAEEFLAGKHFANALSEPASGNRFLNPQQEAPAAPGGYVLDGAKRFVSGSELADYLLVNARVGDAPAFFAVIPDETVSIIPIWDTLGLRATRSQLLSFNHTLLREDLRGRLPGPGDFNAVGAGLPQISLGIADAALAAIVEHASARTILGKPLSHQQWVQFEVADVHTRLEGVRAFIRQTLWQLDAGDPEGFANLGRSKYLANKIAVEIAQLAVRIGGASGYLKTSPIQRHLRNALGGQLMAYSTEVLAGEIGAQVLGVTAEEARA